MNKDDSIDVMRYCSLQKQIDEMYERTKDYGRSQFAEMLVEQRNEIAELKQALNKIKEYSKLNMSLAEDSNQDYVPKYVIKAILKIIDKVLGGNEE